MSHDVYPGAGIDNEPLSSSELQRRMGCMVNSLYGITVHPPGNSEEIRAFGVTALERAKHAAPHSPFHSVLTDLIQIRQDLPIDHQAQLLRIGFQYELCKVEPTYPAGGKDPRQWHRWMDRILEDSYARADLEDALLTHYNQANDPKRYAGPKLALLACADRLPPSFDIVDSGCSAGLGQIQIGENLPFSQIKFVTDQRFMRFILHQVLKSALDVGKNIGFDRVVDSNIDWVEACSYYPHEYADKSKIAQRQALYKKRDGFRITYGDINDGPDNVGLAEVRKHVPNGKFNVSMSVTSLYEIPSAKRDQAVKNLESLADHLTIIQDVAEIDPNDPTKLIFATDIYAPTAHYNLFMKDVSRPDQPFEKLGRWANFRCHTFTPTRTLLNKLLRQV